MTDPRPTHYDARDVLSADQLAEIEEKYDPEMRFRELVRPVAILVGAILFLLSCYHYYTAGFGIPQATVHRGLHLAATTFLVFMSFSAFGRQQVAPGRKDLAELDIGRPQRGDRAGDRRQVLGQGAVHHRRPRGRHWRVLR